MAFFAFLGLLRAFRAAALHHTAKWHAHHIQQPTGWRHMQPPLGWRPMRCSTPPATPPPSPPPWTGAPGRRCMCLACSSVVAFCSGGMFLFFGGRADSLAFWIQNDRLSSLVGSSLYPALVQSLGHRDGLANWDAWLSHAGCRAPSAFAAMDAPAAQSHRPSTVGRPHCTMPSLAAQQEAARATGLSRRAGGG